MPKVSLDKKRKAAIAAVMAYLQEEANMPVPRSLLPTTTRVIPRGSRWRLEGRRLLMESRGRPSGKRLR